MGTKMEKVRGEWTRTRMGARASCRQVSEQGSAPQIWESPGARMHACCSSRMTQVVRWRERVTRKRKYKQAGWRNPQI